MDLSTLLLRDLPGSLRTDRLQLEILTPAHADELAAAFAANHAHLAPWIGVPDSPEALPARLAAIAVEAEAGRAVRYLARDLDGALVGCVGLDVDLARGVHALAGWLVADRTRRGYARELAGALCQIAFEHSAVEALAIDCDQHNLASAALARAVGFVRSGATGDTHHWTASRTELGAWHYVRSVAARAGTATVDGDHGVIRVTRADGTALDLWIATVRGEPYATTAAVVGRDDAYPARALLAHSLTLGVGSLALDGESIVLRHSCAPRGLTAGTLTLLMHEVARMRGIGPIVAIELDAFACAL